MINTALDVAPQLGVLATCAAFGIALATYYRKRAPAYGPPPPRPSPPRRLGDPERQVVLDVLHEERFADLAPGSGRVRVVDVTDVRPTKGPSND